MAFLGIDAGASSAKWALADESGIVLTGAAGPIDGHITRSESRERMQQTLTQIKAECSQNIDRLVIGITGIAETPVERTETIKIIAEIFTGSTIDLLSDIHLAYRVHFPHESGILLYAGTGAVACTQVNGELKRVGGWGYLLGDEGAGYWIGRTALRALLIYIDKDQIPPSGSFEAAVADAINARSWGDVKNFAYGNNRSEIAALARVVFLHAGQKSADEILVEAADHLFALTVRVDEITGDPSRPIIFTGGTSRGVGPLNDRLSHLLAKRLTVSDRDIAQGAALMAREASSQG
jgi:N-acetylglucosamine kinase-like BadF-type ATPase